MRLRQWLAIIGLIIAFSGCALRYDPVAKYKKEIGDPSVTQYKYAYTGQVRNGVSGETISNFSVEILKESADIDVLINSLGNEAGLFHVSRNNKRFGELTVLPVMVDAPGFEPAIKLIDVAKDCVTGSCLGQNPLSVLLQPETPEAPQNSSVENLLAATAGELIAEKGTLATFNELVTSGKIDPNLQALLADSRNGDQISDIIVMLGGAGLSTDTAKDLLSTIEDPNLNSVLPSLGKDVPDLAASLASNSPKLGASLVALQPVLPLLGSVGNGLAKSGSPFGQILSTFSKLSNDDRSMSHLVGALGGSDASKAPQLAATTFLPFAQDLAFSLFKRRQGKNERPFGKFLSRIVSSSKLTDQVASGSLKSALFQQASPYLQGLVQGLQGRNAPEIAALFNKLVAGDNPLANLKAFPKSAADLKEFSSLLPYIEPILKGLNGGDSKAISTVLAPFLSSENPSELLAGLLSGKGNAEAIAKLASSFSPGLSDLLKESVPGKQVFSAQLLEGLSSGDFKDIRVQDALDSVPAMVISGRAQDIFKAAQLPNVKKLVRLKE